MAAPLGFFSGASRGVQSGDGSEEGRQTGGLGQADRGADLY
jgi:hypothetical protein